jgi:opacity protein-like surface antigen
MIYRTIFSSLFLFLFLSSPIFAQQTEGQEKLSGKFSLGTRTTLSLFNGDDEGGTGIGIGGQFRVQLSNKINSEWFADFITSSIDNIASRNDYHIGWSLMYYPGKKTDFTNFLQPYILAGHCFDYTRIEEDNNASNFKNRLSMAMQAGAGTHFNLTPRFDFSLSAQYMLHLGKDIHAEVSGNDVVLTKTNSSKPEGHMLVTLSINYKIANLW